MAEIDTLTNKIKLTFQCDDSRVTTLFLRRRDVSMGQSAYNPPGQIEHIKLGHGDHARGQSRFDDIRFGYDPDLSLLWNGIFKNDGQQIVFLDKACVLEHTYQYQLYGIDRFGNRTSVVTSQRLFLANVASVLEPQNVNAIVQVQGNTVSGIQVSWQDGNIDISAEDLIGSQLDLAESSVRTLFQLQRRKSDESIWYDFPLTYQNTFFDQAANAPIAAVPMAPLPVAAPANYAEQQFLRTIATQLSASQVPDVAPLTQQPPQVLQNETYVYRVQAFQSGGFVSNFSDQVSVNAVQRVLAPINFRIKTPDTKARPFYTALNWDTDVNSGVVDRWVIERAVVNNAAAAKLSNLNPSDFDTLEYSTFQTVYSEANTFQERGDQELSNGGILGGTGDTTLLTGQNHFIDHDVTFGNSYFYRIQAVSPVGGQNSDWSYRGIKVTDATYETGAAATTPPATKTSAASNPVPVIPAPILMPISLSTSLTLKSLPPTPVVLPKPQPITKTILSPISLPTLLSVKPSLLNTSFTVKKF